jgi:hypothetical protein
MTATYETVADNRRGLPRWLALLAQVPSRATNYYS